MLNDLYPLLRTVQPAELNYTLNALATALEGRGDKLGESLVTLNSYLKRLNPQIPALIDDLKLLSTVTDTYADVVPQLAETLRNTVKTGNTLVSKEKKLNNIRSSTSEELERQAPPRRLTLEESLEFANDDECVEVTPEKIRIRKVILDQTERGRAASKAKRLDAASR